MVVPWAATQLDREDSQQSGRCCSLVGGRVQRPRDIGSHRTKVGSNDLAAGGPGPRRWTASPTGSGPRLVSGHQGEQVQEYPESQEESLIDEQGARLAHL